MPPFEYVSESKFSPKPLLVLLHGTWASADDFAPVGESLSDVADAIVPDLPGHGTRASEPYSLAACVDLIDDIVEEAHGRPVVIVGHSLGGFAAMWYAEQHPDALAGLVLVGSSVEPKGIGAVAYKVVGRIVDVVGPKRLGAALRREPYAPIAPLWDEVIDRCSVRQLRDVSCPVLLMGGAFDQLHVGRRSFARAARNATVVTARRRTHAWPYKYPLEAASQLRTWMRSVIEPTLATAEPV